MAEEKRKGLGRGLSALLGESGLSPSQLDAVQHTTGISPGLRSLPVAPVSALVPGRFQPRKTFDEESLQELAESVRTKGMLQPILVRPHPEEVGLFEIIAGERRWRAAQRALLHEVPILVKDFTDREAAEVALVENLQRKDLSPLEEAEGYTRLLKEFNHTQEELARALGKSRSHVTNMMRLLSLPDSVRALVDDGKLSAGHARALVAAADPVRAAAQVVEKGLSVRQTEALVTETGKAKPQSKRQSKGGGDKDPDLAALERDLTESLGLKVSLKSTGQGGELIVQYRTLEQLDDLLTKLAGEPK